MYVNISLEFVLRKFAVVKYCFWIIEISEDISKICNTLIIGRLCIFCHTSNILQEIFSERKFVNFRGFKSWFCKKESSTMVTNQYANDIHSITEWVTADDVEDAFSMSKSALQLWATFARPYHCLIGVLHCYPLLSW